MGFLITSLRIALPSLVMTMPPMGSKSIWKTSNNFTKQFIQGYNALDTTQIVSMFNLTHIRKT